MTEDTETNSTNLSQSYKSARRISFLDLFTYLFCTASLVISIYTYYYQLSVESKAITKSSYVETRLEQLENQVQLILQAQGLSTNNKNSNRKDSVETVTLDEFPDVADVVKKVALQEFGLERLKRDISHLKLTTRRESRQASLQQSPECICPAGN